MSDLNVYGFILEDAVISESRIDLSNSFDQGYGVLIGEPANYIVNKSYVTDSRPDRLSVLPGVAEDSIPKPKVRFVFDNNRVETAIFNNDNMPIATQYKIFNIIDRLLYQDNLSDEDVETILTSDTSLYDGYVPDSYIHSDIHNEITVYTSQNNSVSVVVPDWVEFRFMMPIGEVTFHLWFSKSAFTQSYPFTTVTNVIPPFDVSIIADPAVLVQYGNLSMLETASNFIFDKANIETTMRDQNGIYSFKTKYVVDGTRSMQLPFAISYCGAKPPSPLECRKAIREYLENNTVVSTDILESVLPEVYVNCRFFIAPLWDVYSVRSERDVYNSIWNVKTLRDKAAKVFADFDQNWIDTYLEMLTNAKSKVASVAIPDAGNDSVFSILEQHPTYQDYSSQVPGWKYMTDETQEFAGKFNRAMSVLEGSSSSTEFIIFDDRGIKWLAFASGKSEYLILTPESYNMLVTV